MATKASRRVVVLGGGVGGLIAANRLRQRLGSGHEVVLVDRQARYLFTPSLLWLLAGARRPGQAVKDLRRMTAPGVTVVPAEVQRIDPDSQRVLTSAGDQSYDYLVIALGADLAPAALPGYQEAAHNFFDLEGATKLGRELASIDAGRVVVAISSMPYKCPAAPYEAALLIDDLLRRRGVRDRVQVDVYTPEPQPMPVAGPVVGGAVRQLLETQGIGYHPTTQLASIDPERKQLVFKDGSSASFDLLAGVPPHRPPRAVRESPLANEAGWIPVDPRKLTTRVENVYAIGDVVSITLANGKPLPKAGVFAHAEGLAVADSIAAEIQGGEARTFDGVGYCWVSMTTDRAGFASGDFYAEPDPAMTLREPGRIWHAGKVLFERYWMGIEPERFAARVALEVGSRLYGIPASF